MISTQKGYNNCIFRCVQNRLLRFHKLLNYFKIETALDDYWLKKNKQKLWNENKVPLLLWEVKNMELTRTLSRAEDLSSYGCGKIDSSL